MGVAHGDQHGPIHPRVHACMRARTHLRSGCSMKPSCGSSSSNISRSTSFCRCGRTSRGGGSGGEPRPLPCLRRPQGPARGQASSRSCCGLPARQGLGMHAGAGAGGPAWRTGGCARAEAGSVLGAQTAIGGVCVYEGGGGGASRPWAPPSSQVRCTPTACGRVGWPGCTAVRCARTALASRGPVAGGRTVRGTSGTP